MSRDDGSDRHHDKDFPVDTLGIPILVDVVESGTPPVPPEPILLDPHSDDRGTGVADQDDEGEKAAAGIEVEREDEAAEASASMRQIDEISAAVTEEIVKKIKPLIRKRVRRALRAYDAVRAPRTDAQDCE